MAELEPHIVTRAGKPPGKCIASGDTEGPFIDTARTVGAPGQVYVSVRWLESVATELLGMVPEAEVEERFEESDCLLREQGERLAALQRVADAAEEYEGAREALAAPARSWGVRETAEGGWIRVEPNYHEQVAPEAGQDITTFPGGES